MEISLPTSWSQGHAKSVSLEEIGLLRPSKAPVEKGEQLKGWEHLAGPKRNLQEGAMPFTFTQ